MPDELMQRLSNVRPALPSGLLEPDHELLEEILMTEVPTKRRLVTPLRLSAVAALAAALVVALMATATPNGAPPALNMRAIAASTSAALSSGRAHVQFRSESDGQGAYPSTSEFVVEFAGDNRSMTGTVDPGDGRGAPFPIANKIVDGQFYLQDGMRWVKDTNASNVSGSDVFSVDPRNFLAGVAGAAAFEHAGTETIDGVHTRHLRATRLDDVPDFNLGLGRNPERHLTRFELWVDDADVVRALVVAAAKTEQTYPLAQTQVTKDADGRIHKSLDESNLGDPVTVTTTEAYKVTFTDIGASIDITAPANAVEVAGKG